MQSKAWQLIEVHRIVSRTIANQLNQGYIPKAVFARKSDALAHIRRRKQELLSLCRVSGSVYRDSSKDEQIWRVLAGYLYDVELRLSEVTIKAG